MIKHYVESPSVTMCMQNISLSQNTDLEVEKSLKVHKSGTDLVCKEFDIVEICRKIKYNKRA